MHADGLNGVPPPGHASSDDQVAAFFSRSRLLTIGLTSFIAGNLAYFAFPGASFPWFIVAVIAAGMTVFPKRARRIVFIAGSAFLAAWLLTAREAAFWEALPDRIEYRGEVTLIHIGERSTFFRPLVLRPDACADVSLCPQTDILLRAPLVFEGTAGMRFQLTCTLERPQSFDPTFDYRHFLAAQGIGFVCEKPNGLEPQADAPIAWRAALDRIRHAVASRIRSALPEPEAGLALGLALGGSDYLSRETKDMFASVGLSHIVAVSGYNMTLVVQFVLIVGLLFGLWRRGALMLALFCVGIFLLLIGVPASALRAALMTLAAFGAYFVGRLPASFNALFLAAALMLAVHPLIARFDVGFQLSFLATFALLASSPWVERWLPLHTLLGKGLALIVFTTVIEFLTAPVLLATFGQIAWIAPLANLMVLPFVTLATLSLIGFLIGAGFVPPLAPLFALPLWLILKLIVEMVRFLANLPFGQYRGEAIPLWFSFLWYVLLVVLGLWLSRKYRPYVFSLER